MVSVNIPGDKKKFHPFSPGVGGWVLNIHHVPTPLRPLNHQPAPPTPLPPPLLGQRLERPIALLHRARAPVVLLAARRARFPAAPGARRQPAVDEPRRDEAGAEVAIDPVPGRELELLVLELADEVEHARHPPCLLEVVEAVAAAAGREARLVCEAGAEEGVEAWAALGVAAGQTAVGILAEHGVEAGCAGCEGIIGGSWRVEKGFPRLPS
jgi:hypothetical protein